MEIMSVNAHSKLIAVASSIGRNPLSWQGWHCLHVEFSGVDDDMEQECLLWTKSIVESFLRGVEGRVYFCGDNHIHVICKKADRSILEEAGQQICALVYSESAVVSSHRIYDLAAEGFSYARMVLEKSGNIFSLPVAQGVALGMEGRCEIEGSTEKPILNHQDFTKVLLVEDDPVTRWMVRNTLKHECQFATAPTANQAFAMYSSYQPDIVFLDINLPDKNGYAVLEWILRNDPGACVVMFSSNDNLDNIANAMDDGASGFIAKPFVKESLLHYIRNHTG